MVGVAVIADAVSVAISLRVVIDFCTVSWSTAMLPLKTPYVRSSMSWCTRFSADTNVSVSFVRSGADVVAGVVVGVTVPC